MELPANSKGFEDEQVKCAGRDFVTAVVTVGFSADKGSHPIVSEPLDIV
jgi:hypothetical protein